MKKVLSARLDFGSGEFFFDTYCIPLAILVVLHRNDGDVTTPLGTHGRQIVRTGRGLHVCDWKLKMVIMNSADAIIFVPEVIYAEIRDT